MTPSTAPVLLEARNLKVHFPVLRGTLFQRHLGDVKAVDGINLSLHKGETLGLVGESGCGKSTAGRALLQLIRPTSGEVFFNGTELTSLWHKRWGTWVWKKPLRQLRQHMQMVFQDPYASLNPRMTVEDIIAEPLRIFQLSKGAHLRKHVQELMLQVGLDPRYVRRYPHEFSGGQRQRIGIARALALSPELIVADEPISALDVSIQAQIMNLLKDLQKQRGLTYLFVAHDLAAVRHMSTRIAVMYLGKIVETGSFETLLHHAVHPYTQALISAIPIPNPEKERSRTRMVLHGDVPSPINPPTGCAFHPRCPFKMPQCVDTPPHTIQITDNHSVSCHLAKTPSSL
jgi:oligopeptide transport system ATP-binding protein